MKVYIPKKIVIYNSPEFWATVGHHINGTGEYASIPVFDDIEKLKAQFPDAEYIEMDEDQLSKSISKIK